jgi:hypothetical protein
VALVVAAGVGPVAIRAAQRRDAEPVTTVTTSAGTRPVVSRPATSAPAATAATAGRPAGTTAPVTTVPATAVGPAEAGAEPAIRFGVAVDVAVADRAGPADAWVLRPLGDAPTRLAAVAAALAPGTTVDGVLPGGATFAAAPGGTTWRYAAPVRERPVPERCVGLDLSDPRAFPRCEQALVDAQVAWRGGPGATARAVALWRRMGYDLAAYTPAAGPDADGWVSARLLLGSEPSPFGLRVRFQGDAVEVAEGVLVEPAAVASARGPASVALAELQRHGAVEVRTARGSTVDPSDVAAEVTVVGAHAALVALESPPGDPARYVVPGYAFVAADGVRYLRPAAVTPPWLPAPG